MPFYISTDRFSLYQFNSLRQFVTYHHFSRHFVPWTLEEQEWQIPAWWNVKCLWRALLVEERRPAHTGGVWLHLRSWEAPLAKNPQTERPRESQGRSSASSTSAPSGPTTTLRPTWTSLDIPGHIGHIPTLGRDTRLLRGPSFFPGKRQHFCCFGQGHKLQMCLLLVLVAYFFSGVQGSALTVCRV